MVNNDEKYQNILEQIHELNRQNFLNDNEKVEELFKKISNLEKDVLKYKNNYKFFYILISFLLINLVLSFYIVSKISNLQKSEKVILNEKKMESTIRDNMIVLSELDANISIDESYQEISPIIRKGTLYFCNDDKQTNKIPYTVEIKGKLYKDKFVFFIKENDSMRECFIKKDNI